MTRKPPIGCTVVHLCIGTLVAVSGLAQAAGKEKSQTALGVPCSEIFERGIDMQENLRATAIRVACGLDVPGSAGAEGLEADSVDEGGPFANINVITGTETYPHVTQSESMVWSTPDGQTIVVNYNDSNTAPNNYSGVSVSVDGGQTFNRILPAPFATGHGTNFGDPIVVYNNALGKWFAGDLATGCGGQGTGLWTSLDGMSWTPGACAHNGGADDRESMWVDNNAGSPFYGRMYISWNDFGAGQNIFVVRSDDGVTWSAPVRVQSGGFVRNIQLTGSPDDGGTVFIAGMDEGGGGVNNRINYIYRSLDGGVTWTQIQQGPPFAPPGQALCGYFAAVTPIWRHMGWGQPAVGPGGVIHYVYAARGANAGDLGDILYIRSDDNGTTWTAPITLNSDAATGGNHTQWMPSLSATPEGLLVGSWYDRRNTANNSYEFWLIRSSDNGQSWGDDQPVSDVISPQPEQPDPTVQSCYAGDYNYHTATSGNSWVTWTDGRVQVSGHNQQDVFFAAVPQIQTGGAIEGTVTDGAGNAPIAGARVQAVGPVTRVTSTRADGTYHLGSLPEGSYDMTVTAFGFNPGTASGVMVVDGQTTTQNFTLTPGPSHRVSGTVTNSATGMPVAGATLRILDTPIAPATSDANGMYAFPVVPDGSYRIQVTAAGLQGTTQSIVVDHDLVVDFALDPIPLALIQDQSPWGSTQNETLLTARGVSFQIITSDHMADTDFSQFRKVVLVSQQPDIYYTRLGASRGRFEDYVNGNGTLEMHVANFGGSQVERTTLPFGLRVTPTFCGNTVTVVDPTDPLLNSPNAITSGELQGWNCSSHGALIGVDALGLNVVVNTAEGPQGPSTAEGGAGTGNGRVVITYSPIEYTGTPNTRRFNENLLCNGLSGVGTCP